MNANDGPMPRNILVCCDGTWNRPEGLNSTNVVYAYDACVTAPERRIVSQDGRGSGFQGALFELADCNNPAQGLYYQTGVGSGTGRFSRWVEGGTGTGIRRNIINAYRWIAANYRDGNRIFLFGFSRGAYTARSLGGLITRCGLLYPEFADEADNVFELYRDRDLIGASGHIAAALINGKARPVGIHFIGVWDTVGALGIPIMGRSFNLLSVWRNQFHDVALSNDVRHAYHAVAMDELRPSFVPTLWEVPPDRSPHSPVEQVWFRGAHSDVGGGYPNDERHLAGITLGWMMDKAHRAGLRIDQAYLDQVCAGSDKQQVTLHDEIGSKWRMLGAWPRGCPVNAEPLPAPSPLTVRQLSVGALHESVFRVQPQAPDIPGVVEGLDRPIVPLSLDEDRTIPIKSAYWWNRTGIALEAGATYTVSCRGTWADSKKACDAEGWDAPGWHFKLFKRFRRKRDAQWFAAIGVVMNHAFFRNREEPVWKGLYHLLVEDPVELTSRQINLGMGGVLRPQCDGLLHCFANDVWWLYGNNGGAVELEITRVDTPTAPAAGFAAPRGGVDTLSGALAQVEQYEMRENGTPARKQNSVVVDERREHALGQWGAGFGAVIVFLLSQLAAIYGAAPAWWALSVIGGGLLGWWLLPLAIEMPRRTFTRVSIAALVLIAGLAVLTWLVRSNNVGMHVWTASFLGLAAFLIGAAGWVISLLVVGFALSQSLKR